MKPRYVLLGLVLGFAPTRLATAPADYWKGRVEVAAFRFAESDINALGEDPPVYRVLPERRTYAIYQNPKGIVRSELTFLSRNRVIPQGSASTPNVRWLLRLRQSRDLCTASWAHGGRVEPKETPKPVKRSAVKKH